MTPSTAAQRNSKLLTLAEELLDSNQAFKGIQDLLSYQNEHSIISLNVPFTLHVLANYQNDLIVKLFDLIRGEV